MKSFILIIFVILATSTHALETDRDYYISSLGYASLNSDEDQVSPHRGYSFDISVGKMLAKFNFFSFLIEPGIDWNAFSRNSVDVQLFGLNLSFGLAIDVKNFFIAGLVKGTSYRQLSYDPQKNTGYSFIVRTGYNLNKKMSVGLQLTKTALDKPIEFQSDWKDIITKWGIFFKYMI